MKIKVFALSIACALGLSLGLARFESSYAKDRDPTPEEVVAGHLKSIGNPDLMAGIKNRGMSGMASVEFIQGGVGTLEGQCMVVSAGHGLSIILNYGGVDYRGEYFAYDGTDVEVATINPGQRSPLGDFIFRYKGLMKEGLLGGVWSLGWPLLDVEERNPSLKYNSATVEGHELHQIDYRPRGGLNNIKVKLFFEPDTFRHLRTEYRLRIEGEQALQAGQKIIIDGAPNSGNFTSGQTGGPNTRDAGMLDPIAYSHYLLVEKFGDFKRVELKDAEGSETMSLVLPQSYNLEYSVEGHGSTFLGRWDLKADQWMQNGTIDTSVFKAH